MKEYDVRVLGGPKAKRKPGRVRSAVRQAGRALQFILLKPRLLILAVLAGFILFAGTPYAGWDYECRHPFSPGQPCRSVSYCAYYGVQGRRVEFPEYGESCQLITFIPLDWGRIIDRVMP